MCGIYGSFNKETFELLKIHNSSRGVVNDSIKKINVCNKKYIVGHIQAPTSNSSKKHPAFHYNDVEDNSFYMLWHNGLVKQSFLKNHNYSGWDTEFILRQIVSHGFSALNNIDGSFACVLYAGNDMFIFRNVLSPLYIDDDLNISSIKYDGMLMLEPEKVFKVTKDGLLCVDTFTTKNNPYNL